MMRADLESQAGFSLAETIITIAIVGITFTAILTAMQVSITVSSTHRATATADGVARSAAEWLKSDAEAHYVSCAGAGAYSFGGLPVPPGYNVSVQRVEYWNGITPTDAAYTPAFVSSQASCQAGGDQGLQRITISVSAADGQANESVEIIKRVAT